ncbi:MAG: DUF262 domain-containing protein [Nodosilinea sp.]
MNVKAKTKLLPGENFQPNDGRKTSQPFLSDDDINEKYKKGEIRIVTEQARYPLDSIEGMLDSRKYDLNPEYQRRKRWDNTRKSRLIESFIMNVPIPPIFLYEIDYSIYEVMDGLQRLTAIYDFYKGNFELEGLEYWKELNGRTCSDLPEQVKRGIDRRYLSSIVLLQETAKTDREAEFLKQIVFERLNSGGEKLTPQETRNALYNGVFNQKCISLSKNICFRKMWNLPLYDEGEDSLLKSDSYREMEDVGLVLRFFAYRHLEKLRGMTVEKFLDEYLKNANSYSENIISGLESIFEETMELIHQIFGDSAFFLPPKKRAYKSPTKTIYDPMVQAFSNNIKHREKLLREKEKIGKNLYSDDEKLSKNGRYLFDGRYNNHSDVQSRIDFYDEFLKGFIV